MSTLEMANLENFRLVDVLSITMKRAIFHKMSEAWLPLANVCIKLKGENVLLISYYRSNSGLFYIFGRKNKSL